MFSFHSEGTLPLGFFTTWKHFLCVHPEVKQVLYAKLWEMPLYPCCIVLHWWNDKFKKSTIFFFKGPIIDSWGICGRDTGRNFRIYTPSSHARLEQYHNRELCVREWATLAEALRHRMLVANVSQGGYSLGVMFLFYGEKHCRRASEGLASSLPSLILLCSGRRLLP